MLLQEPTISTGSPSSPQQILLVAHPDVIAVALAEAVLGGVAALVEELRLLGLDQTEVLGMDIVAPEIGVLQIFFGAIAQ